MADELEVMEAEVKISSLSTSIQQARLDQARARKRISALEADIERHETSLADLKKHLEDLKNG